MDAISFKTKSVPKKEQQRNWLVLDAEDQVLGRFASQAAHLLRGKHKVSFTPNVDCGDKVIIINAEKVRLTGNKAAQREHLRHTGYPGGQRSTTPQEILDKHPERLIEQAIRRMLPKNTLGRQMFRNLFVYTGSEHPHEAQQPQVFELPYSTARKDQ